MKSEENKQELESSLRTFAQFLKRAWIDRGDISFVKVGAEPSSGACYIYDLDGNFLCGDGDILKCLDECVAPLANHLNEMGITTKDKSFVSYARRFVGKQAKTIDSHFKRLGA